MGNGHAAVVRLLLASDRVDPNIKDIENQTTLWRALKNKPDDVLQSPLTNNGVNLIRRTSRDRHLCGGQ
jgi:hypothetical protein